MPDLLVAVWGIPWDEFRDFSLEQKWVEMYGAITATEATLTRAAHSMGCRNHTMLFVAPEYYFVHDAEFKPLSFAEAADIQRRLRALSAQFDLLVIVPGTINYRVTATEQDKRTWVANNREPRSHKVISLVPVYFSGSDLYRYYKREADTVYNTDHPQHDAYFSPGMKPATFQCNNLRFGIDVCADYQRNRVVGDVPTLDLDVHILVAGTKEHNFNQPQRIAARDGGYFIHADSKENAGSASHARRNGVWAVNRGGGLHGDSSGRTARDLLSDANIELAKAAQPGISEEDIRTAMSQAAQRNFGNGNVTRMSPLRYPVDCDHVELFLCPGL